METFDTEVYDLSWRADLIVVYKNYRSAALRRRQAIIVSNFVSLLSRLWTNGLIRLEYSEETGRPGVKDEILSHMLLHWPRKEGGEESTDDIDILIFLETAFKLIWVSDVKPSDATRLAIYG